MSNCSLLPPPPPSWSFFLTVPACARSRPAACTAPISVLWRKAFVVVARLNLPLSTEHLAALQVTSWALSRTSSQLSASSPLPSPEPPSSSSSLTASLSSPLSGAGGSADSFHFICECFFLTARAMHIGVLKCTAELKETAEEMQRYQQQVVMLERSRPSWAGSPMAAATEGQLREFQQLIQSLQHDNLVIQTALAEPRLVADSIAFYRVMAAWLTRLACSGGAVTYPLPTPCPMARRPSALAAPLILLLSFRYLFIASSPHYSNTSFP